MPHHMPKLTFESEMSQIKSPKVEDLSMNFDENRKKSKMVAFTNDKETVDILECVEKRPKTTKQISELKDIPEQVCQHRLKKLQEKGLIKKANRSIDSNGKRVWSYELK